MKITCIGGGPAGLYFAILMKRRDRDHVVRVIERNLADDTFGFGVVFSDATMERLALADPPSYEAITKSFWHWDRIDVHLRGEIVMSSGHGFAGMSRKLLLQILQERARQLGVELVFGEEVSDVDALAREVDLVVAADGVASAVRTARAALFEPRVDHRPNRFCWLGTTVAFEAFTFLFKENEHGLFRVHAYRYEPGRSTFIVECTDETFARTGLAEDDEQATLAYCQRLFAEELGGHPLLPNRSIWRRFPTVHNGSWRDGNVVLLGDAAHTAHFSVGSGTKLAMEDAVALAAALEEARDLPAALARYEEERRPEVESLQRAAQASLEWFEATERYRDLDPVDFAFSLLTRSLRVTHEGLRLRDPAFVAGIDARFAAKAADQAGVDVAPTTPPMFTPYRLRELVLDNRIVVSSMCQYSADDGAVGDWHLVHLGSRALGGAGLVMAEMTDVIADGRISPGCAGLYRPEHVQAWKRVVDFVHGHSRAKIGVQLAHAGRKGSTRRLWEGQDAPLDADNWPLIAPSALPYKAASQTPRPMTRDDMVAVRDAFVASTRMADEAGFDLLELHCAHGYLLGTFLSPLTNLRDDRYGGPVASRLRYPLEVFTAVREAWPAHKPMSVRISATDWLPGGNTGDDAVVVARAFRDAGCDIVDVSAGQTVAEQQPSYGRLFQTPFSDRIRHEVGVPTMTVGAITSYADVNGILAAGRADLCALARAHLYDPYWTRHAAHEQGWALPWPDQYAAVARFEPRFK